MMLVPLSATDQRLDNMRPLVSVIIPSYNRERYLPDAVRSVFQQTYPALECIVIDDGSTDHTSSVLQRLLTQYPSLRVARKRNGGPSSARNLGLRLCSGSLVSFLDADDILLPDKLERQVNFLYNHPDVGIVYGDYLVVTEDLTPMALFVAEIPHTLDQVDAFCYRNWFNPLVPMIRKEVTDTVGDFDEELSVAEDWDYWIRCASVTRLSYMAGPVALYRQHGEQLHRDYFRMRNACIRVAMKHFGHSRERLRGAMAAIELTHAKHLWKEHDVSASFVALLKYVFMDYCGLHAGGILLQLKAMRQSQLKSI